MALSLGVDVGATKILAGVVDSEGRIIRSHRLPTTRGDVSSLVEAVHACVVVLDGAVECTTLGVSIAAFLDASRERILLAPNGGWAQEPLRTLIERATHRATALENDGNAAAWGEARFGAGRSVEDFVMVTVGTGVGGGVILDGRLRTGHHGVAGEIGHITMVADGLPCGCGRTGCWEQYASGTALLREARGIATQHPDQASALLGMGDGTPEGISGAHVTEAARVGDPVAIAAFDLLGAWLGRGMADLAAVLDPELFIVGGGVSESGDLLMNPTRSAFAQQAMGKGLLPRAEIRPAELGERAGVVGAADLARIRLAGARGDRPLRT